MPARPGPLRECLPECRQRWALHAPVAITDGKQQHITGGLNNANTNNEMDEVTAACHSIKTYDKQPCGHGIRQDSSLFLFFQQLL